MTALAFLPETELAAVSATALTRTYGEGGSAVRALRGVSIEVPQGQFAAVMGPSGSGKSTLMHLLAGLDTPTSGSVTVDGREIGGLGDKALTQLRRDRLGFVFQSFNLVPVLTAEENILLPLTLAGKKPDREWHDTLIAAVGLGDRLTHRPAELSGGQQQRVAVARALASRPEIVFADEPTGNLDSQATRDILGLFAELHAAGRTVVIITHEAEVAAQARRVIRLRDGLVVDDTTAGAA